MLSNLSDMQRDQHRIDRKYDGQDDNEKETELPKNFFRRVVVYGLELSALFEWSSLRCKTTLAPQRVTHFNSLDSRSARLNDDFAVYIRDRLFREAI